MKKCINKFIKEQRGITLVALIITIVVMLILASATLVIVIGDNGLITKSKRAKFVTEVEDLKERVKAKMAQLGTLDYHGSVNSLLGTNTKFNDKFTIQNGELVYIGDQVSSRETTWLAELGILEYANWYHVAINDGNGNTVLDKMVREGNKISKPTNPIHPEGYDFIGWYYLVQGGTEENPTYTEYEFTNSMFNSVITQDYNIYAKYRGEAVMSARKNNSYFWQETYRTNITSIKFTDDDSDIPANPSQTWNVRENENSSNIMAYLSSDGKSLVIYSPSTIHANQNAYAYFKDFTNLASITFENFDTSKVTTMYAMFYGCSGLTSLDVSNFNTSKATSMYSMFYNCQALTSLDVSKFDTSKVTTMRSMFHDCKSLTSLDTSHFDTSEVTTMYAMFYGCNNLTGLDVSKFDTSKVETMYAMFYGCSSLTSLDVSKFDTSKVETMYAMFYNCSKLTSLDVSHFDTSKVTTMYVMFYGCSGLTSLDVSHFNTSNVTDLGCMFGSCTALTSLDVSNFNTSKATSMYRMFYDCRALTSLDVSKFDTSNVTDMRGMFYNCNNISSLNLTNFDTRKVTNYTFTYTNTTTGVTAYYGMLRGCTKLSAEITIAGNITNADNYKDMFLGAATASGAQITVNYTASTESLVDAMILEKSASSNIVKGTLKVVE